MPYPHITRSPAVEENTENLEEEFPGIFPACVITRAKSKKLKHDTSMYENVDLSNTFMTELDTHEPNINVYKSVNNLESSSSDSNLLNNAGGDLLTRGTLIEDQQDDKELAYIRKKGSH